MEVFILQRADKKKQKGRSSGKKSVFDRELTNTSKKALKQYRAGWVFVFVLFQWCQKIPGKTRVPFLWGSSQHAVLLPSVLERTLDTCFSVPSVAPGLRLRTRRGWGFPPTRRAAASSPKPSEFSPLTRQAPVLHTCISVNKREFVKTCCQRSLCTKCLVILLKC